MQTKFDEYLEFPCDFPFRVMGLARETLADDVVAVLQQHAPGDYQPKVKPSRNGKYYSVAVRVTVTSKDHIETLYTTLAAIKDVVHVL